MNKLYCINFTRWKQSHILSFLTAYFKNQYKIEFISSFTQAEKRGFDEKSQLITWASKNQTESTKLVKKWGGSFWSMEDGFIRSAGLGTDLTSPASLVLDKQGIYYDPTKVSDLEILLQTKQFSGEELIRADLLRQSILENELSKYNLGGSLDKTCLPKKTNQKIILIPGQVEDDASILKGCVDIKTNTDLINKVKEENPTAFIVYKPHPDVVSGNRHGKVDEVVTNKNCDLVILDVSITDCLAIANEVHTMTSLVGFEALLRDLKVVCYGLPFYSGWGLTKDNNKIERRTRRLELNELIHAALIDYPLYINWKTAMLTTPEFIVAQLRRQIDVQGGKQSNQISNFTRTVRKIKNYIKGVFLPQ